MTRIKRSRSVAGSWWDNVRMEFDRRDDARTLSVWISATVMALVFSVAGYFVKAKSLGMSFGLTLATCIVLIDGALLVDVIVRRLRR